MPWCQNAAADKDAFHATFFIFDASSFLAHPPFVSRNYAFHWADHMTARQRTGLGHDFDKTGEREGRAHIWW